MKKYKAKIYGNILCDIYGEPYKMIIVSGRNETIIPVSNSTLNVCKKAARDVYGVTDLYVSKVIGKVE